MMNPLANYLAYLHVLVLRTCFDSTQTRHELFKKKKKNLSAEKNVSFEYFPP